jgi:mitochondrial fission protein ELM1
LFQDASRNPENADPGESPNEARNTMTSGSTWVLTEGKAGMVVQATGLAEAVGLPITQKTVLAPPPWRWIPPLFWPGSVSGAGPDSDPLDPPYPDLLVSCGRQSVGPARWVRARSKGGTFAVHIQNPRVGFASFDLIVAPMHDQLRGSNVMRVSGSLSQLTEAKVAEAAQRLAPELEHLPRPLVAVLIGGSNKVFRLTDEATIRLSNELVRLSRKFGVGLAVTTSRRTGPAAEALLRERLKDVPAEIWDGTGANPYFGYLGLADYILVTCDSVNMVSEACSTGKPVYIIALPGRQNSKFSVFLQSLIDAGKARAFSGELGTWQYEPLEETERVAREVRRRLGMVD